ncbi:MAG: dihydrolipoyl dehydrogenase [Planctomycetota bacterium]|jgi:dihydrolipoamide dehydrogenase
MSDDAGIREAEVVVIGAGPGGYAAAFAAADRGMKVILVDAGERPGGVCLNRGCIPSKTLLHVGRVITEAGEFSSRGVKFNSPQIDLAALRKWKDDVIDKNAKGIRQLAKSRGVELIRAWARFEQSQILLLSSEAGGEADQGMIRFERAIVATGSLPAVIPALDIGSERVMDSTSALELPEVPGSLLVIGGGYIGLEMGTIYAALGSEVTVVEMTDGLLPGTDRDLVRILEARLKNTFKDIYLNTTVADMSDTDKGVKVKLESSEGKAPAEASFDLVLVAVGRKPNSDGLALANTQVKVSPAGFVEVDEQQRTTDEHIYAIGDVVGGPMLAHKASYEAKIAVDAMIGEPAAFDARAVPAVVFTDPQIAWAGLTENQAGMGGMEVEIAKFPWGASGKATALGRNDGLTKLIVSPESKRVLGAGIVGINAGDLISELVLAIEMGANAQDVAMSIHPHPTLSETVGEAAELAFGTTIHIYKSKK